CAGREVPVRAGPPGCAAAERYRHRRRGAGARRALTEPAKGAVVVTGAGGGIGRAVSERLARDGFAVAAFDVSLAAAEATASAVAGEARAYEVDVRDAAALAAAVGRAEAELAPVTCAVACAGVIENVPLLELPEDAWER